MTLVTRLSATFTDATLPRLISDPVWNEDGGRVLFDAKNLICHPTQSTTIIPSTPLASAGENNWPITTSTGRNYNPSTGRITPYAAGGGSAGITMENSGSGNTGPYPIINNASHAYAGVLWFYVPASFTANSPTLLSKGAGSTSSSNSLTISFDGTTNVLRVTRPKQTDTGYNNNAIVTPTLTEGVHRIGFGWDKADGTWKRRGILNQATAVTGADSVDTFGSDTNGVNLPAAGSTWDLLLFGNIGFGFFNFTNAEIGIYRFYAENLTQSGRTIQQVWDADWAYANGRYS